MSLPETQLVLGQDAPVARRETAVLHPWQCVVVSADGARCEALADAAIAGGWRAIRCRNAEVASLSTGQTRCQLAILDLEFAGRDAERLQRLVESLARQSDMLLLVCGQERDPKEEIWARQLGVWLYLPAVVAGSELTTLCGEAREIAERLAQRSLLSQTIQPCDAALTTQLFTHSKKG